MSAYREELDNKCHRRRSWKWHRKQSNRWMRRQAKRDPTNAPRKLETKGWYS